MSTHAAQDETSISYRARNEIRLLRIFPPAVDAFVQPNLTFFLRSNRVSSRARVSHQHPTALEADDNNPTTFPLGEAAEYGLRLLDGDEAIHQLNSAFDADGAFAHALHQGRARPDNSGNHELFAYLAASCKLQKLQPLRKGWSGQVDHSIDWRIPDGRLAALLLAYNEWELQKQT